MTEFAWDPKTYLQLMAREIPGYPRIQEQLVTATLGTPAHAVLDLGIGSGLTAARVLQAHRDATLVGVDANADMLAAATASLDARRSTLHRSRLQDPLPEGPFDLVISMLAVHHRCRRRRARRADRWSRCRVGHRGLGASSLARSWRCSRA